MMWIFWMPFVFVLSSAALMHAIINDWKKWYDG